MSDAENTNLMDDLAAAWDEVDEETVDVAEQPEELEATEQVEESDTGLEDEAEPEVDGEAVQGAAPEEAVAEKQPDDTDKPPVGLSPTAREAWKDAPQAIKDEVVKREKEFAMGMQKNAEQANRAAQMDQSLAPYQQLFAMNGGVGQTLPGLLQTASQLQMGSAPQKAQTVANLIKQFGVDISILDSVLVGEQPQQNPQQDVQALVDQRFQQMQQAQQQQAMQQTQAQVQSEIQQFSQDPKNEFYNDVAGDMADLMDMAAKRNQAMSMQQAYDRAIQIHPQISQIISSRTSQSSVNTKRRAASTVSGSPGGPGGNQAPDSMRNAIESAWENAGQM